MPFSILPIGRCNGLMFPYEPPPNQTPEGYELQVGDEVELVPEHEYAVWDLAHQEMQVHAQLRFDRRTLTELAGSDPRLAGHDPNAVIERLLELGVLLEVDLEDAAARQDFLARYRMLPTGQGMGNRPERADQYWLGIGGREVIAIPILPFDLWRGSYVDGSMWDYLEAFAAEPSSDPTDGRTAADLANEIIGFVPFLVASRCAVIDLIPTE